MVSLPVVGRQPEAGSLPRELGIPPGATAPLWSQADTVFDAMARLRRDELDPQTTKSLEALLSRSKPSEDCVQAGQVYMCRAWGTPASLEEAVDQADSILLLRVAEKNYGFFNGICGQLLRLTTEAVIKGYQKAENEYFLFYPVARFTAGPLRICKTDVRFAPAPELGGLLLHLQQGRRSTEFDPRFLFIPSPEDVILVNEQEELVLPQRFAEKGRTLKEIRARGSAPR